MNTLQSEFDAYIDANLEWINQYGRDPGVAPRLLRRPDWMRNVWFRVKDGAYWFSYAMTPIPSDLAAFELALTRMFREVVEDAVSVLGSRIAGFPRLKYDRFVYDGVLLQAEHIFSYTPVDETLAP
jgi:hypothetical protein